MKTQIQSKHWRRRWIVPMNSPVAKFSNHYSCLANFALVTISTVFLDALFFVLFSLISVFIPWHGHGRHPLQLVNVGPTHREVVVLHHLSLPRPQFPLLSTGIGPNDHLGLLGHQCHPLWAVLHLRGLGFQDQASPPKPLHHLQHLLSQALHT